MGGLVPSGRWRGSTLYFTRIGGPSRSRARHRAIGREIEQNENTLSIFFD
jgi:hypothetical protein